MQKTGTSYLQSICWNSQEALARQGVDLVPATKLGAFHLMLQVRERFNPTLDPPSVGTALARFTKELEKAPGPRALLSQESLAACTPAQIETLLAACGDREVHVVLTVRDLGRQLPSAWQQTLQAGGSLGYDAYLRRLRRRAKGGALGASRLHLDPPAVLARWAEHVPAERIHVVTVPPQGSSPTLLLERYCRVLGLDPGPLETEVASSNTGLGRVQSEVLRRVNAGLDPRLRRRQVYGDVGKRYFAVQVLGRQERRKTKVPAQFEEWCQRVSEAHIASLADAGYTVEGDLGDLRSHASAFSTEEKAPREREVAASAVQALVLMLGQRAERRTRAGSSATGRLRGPVRRARGLARRAQQRLRARGESH